MHKLTLTPLYCCPCIHLCYFIFFFFFNDTATTEIYTLSLHDALPIFTFRAMADVVRSQARIEPGDDAEVSASKLRAVERTDRKSTRLNSSHANISYAVFCLKKKKKKKKKKIKRQNTKI